MSINGRDVYLGPHGSPESKQRYEDLVRKLLTERERQELKQRAELSTSRTINMLASAYIKFYRTYYVKADAPTTEYGNIWHALKSLRERFGSELVTVFGPLKLMEIQAQLESEGRIVRDQVNRQIGRIRRC